MEFGFGKLEDLAANVVGVHADVGLAVQLVRLSAANNTKQPEMLR